MVKAANLRYLTNSFSVALLVSLLSACTQITPIVQAGRKVMPKVGGVIPSAGSTAGGTLITIEGSGFMPGSSVTIGQLDCLDVTFISTTELRCVTPPNMPIGLQEILIRNPTGRAVIISSGFRAFDTLPPVAGRVVAAQGGILTGTDLKLHMTLGEPVASALQDGQVQGQGGTVLRARLGIQGVLYDH
jgi:hypothetical protein